MQQPRRNPGAGDTTNTLLSQVVLNNNFVPPNEFVQNIHKNMVDMEKQNAQRQGTRFDERSAFERLKPQAEWNAKWQIIMDKLAEKENIKVEDSDLEELAAKEAEKTGISQDKLMKYYKESNRGAAILEDKVVQYLKDNNNLKEIDADEKVKKDQAEKEKADQLVKELEEKKAKLEKESAEENSEDKGSDKEKSDDKTEETENNKDAKSEKDKEKN